MQLKEFFEELQQSTLSPEQKRGIYSKFLAKSNQVLFMRKIIYYSKVTAFSVATVAIFVVFLGTYVPQTESPYVVTDVNDAMITYETDTTRQLVRADALGEIISIKGKIAVYHDDKLVPADVLHKDSKVILQKNASIEFTLLNGLMAAVDGPAEFQILDKGVNEEGHVYVLELLSGNSVRVVSMTSSNDESSEAQIEPKDLKQPKNKKETNKVLVVKTPQVEVAHNDISEPIDMSLKEENGVQTIVNEGSDIVVKQFVNGNELVAVVEKDQRATLDDDDVLLAENISELVDEMTSNQLTIRYDLQESESLAALTTTPFDTGSQELGEISEKQGETFPVPSSVKKIMNDEMLKTLEDALTRSTLRKFSRDVAHFRLAGEREGYEIALGNLVTKLQRGIDAVDGQITLEHSPDRLVMQLNNFVTALDTQWYVTPELVETIKQTRDALQMLGAYEFGSYAKLPKNTTPLAALMGEGVELPVLLQ